MGLVVEVQRRGQGLMLSDRKHRSERGGVVEMRMEQRQAGSEVRTSRDVACPIINENYAKGRKRCLGFLVGGRHIVFRFSRKNIGEQEGRFGGHDNSRSWEAED